MITENYKNSSVTVLSIEISTHRTYLMGIAMIMVLVFHAFTWIYNPIGIINLGYVGVDIFLFLSGFGLSYSYEKKTIIDFYKQRFIRIYPLYFISLIIVYLFTEWTFIDFIYNITTLGYYTNYGNRRFDWYVESLFSLYFIFPFLYNISKFKLKSLLISIIIISLLLYFYKIPWWYDCLISRLPIFIYGIMFRNLSNCSLRYSTIIGIILYLPFYFLASRFLAGSMLTIPIIYISIKLSNRINKRIYNFITILGKYSLEVYLANVLVLYVLTYFKPIAIYKPILYIAIQLMCSYILILSNKKISMYINK